MNLVFLKIWIKKGYITASQARLIDTSLICGITYLLGAVISGDAFSLNALVVAIITPLYMYLTKAQRDLSNKE